MSVFIRNVPSLSLSEEIPLLNTIFSLRHGFWLMSLISSSPSDSEPDCKEGK